MGKITRGYVLAIQNQRDINQFIKTFFSFKLIERRGIGMLERIPKHIAFIPDGN
jgi:hypothetical protein